MSLKKNWRPIIEKFQSRLSTWKAKTLSFGGRLTLIKSVLNSLPTFYLSLFKAPEGILNELEKLRRRFLWGGNDVKRKIHWISWEKVVADKSLGGLGVGTLKAQNLALLTKWWWKLKNGTLDLWKQSVNALHNLSKKPTTTMANKTPGVWCNIANAIKSLNSYNLNYQDIFLINPFSTHDFLFWKDRWCGDLTLQETFPRLYHCEKKKLCKISERMHTEGYTWSWKVKNIDGEMQADIEAIQLLIQNANLNDTNSDQGLTYTINGDGRYHVSSLRKLIDENLASPSANIISWSKVIPLKIRCFMWRVVANRIPVAVNLEQRGIHLSSIKCPLCETGIESEDHLFIQCKYAIETRDWILKWCGIQTQEFRNVADLLTFTESWGSNKATNERIKVIIYGLFWYIWTARNNIVFKQRRTSPAHTADEIISNAFSWYKYRSTQPMKRWIDWRVDPFS